MRRQELNPAAATATFLVAMALPLCAQADRSAERLDVAVGLIQRELHDEAAQELQRFLRESPEHRRAPEAEYRLGICREKLGAPELAIAAYEGALRRTPDPAWRAECRYRLGGLLQGRKQYEAAARCFRQISEQEPSDHYLRVAALYAVGECLRDAGDDPAALTAFRAAAAADQDPRALHAVPALYQAGFVQMRAKEFAAARDLFAAAAARAPEHAAAAECRYLQGEAALRAQDLAGAEQAFAAVADHKEVGARARAGLTRCTLAQARAQLAANQHAQATAIAQRGLAGAPGDLAIEFWEVQAQADLARGANPEAAAAYAQVVRLAADAERRGRARYGECLARHRAGDHAGALAAADALLAQEPAHRLRPEAQLARGECLFAMARYDAAEAAFAAVPPGPLQRKAAFKRAWCSYLQHEHAQAAPRFAALVVDASAADPIAEEALAMQALALLEAGQERLALQAADRYRARHPQGAFLARNERIAARALRRLGDLGAAQSRLEKAAALEAHAGRRSEDELEQAEIAYQRGDFARARKAFATHAGAKDALGARANAGLAWCAFELGEDADCQRFLAQALAHPEAAAERANLLELATSLHHKAGRYDAAAASAREFLAAFPQHPHAGDLRLALGIALARGKHFDAARKVLEDPGSGAFTRPDRAAYELAFVCKELGDRAAARRAFTSVLTTTKDPELAAEANLQLGLFAEAEQDAVTARKHFAAVTGKQLHEARYRLGASHFAGAEWQPALAAFDAVEAGPMRGEALFLAGQCGLRLGQRETAGQRFGALLRESPEHPRAAAAQLAQGEAAVDQGQTDAAIAALEPYLRRTGVAAGDQARAQLALGKARLSRKEYAKAEAAFAAVTAQSDGGLAAAAQFLLGQSRRAQGDLAGAADAFVKLPILYTDPVHVPRGLLEAGRCYADLGQPAKAAKFWKELVERFPDSDCAREAKQKLQGE